MKNIAKMTITMDNLDNGTARFDHALDFPKDLPKNDKLNYLLTLIAGAMHDIAKENGMNIGEISQMLCGILVLFEIGASPVFDAAVKARAEALVAEREAQKS